MMNTLGRGISSSFFGSMGRVTGNTPTHGDFRVSELQNRPAVDAALFQRCNRLVHLVKGKPLGYKSVQVELAVFVPLEGHGHVPVRTTVTLVEFIVEALKLMTLKVRDPETSPPLRCRDQRETVEKV